LLDEDLIEFVKFGLEYTNNLKEDWWELDYEDRLRCQQLFFPGGILFNSERKVSTNEISPFYSLAPNKKAFGLTESPLWWSCGGLRPGPLVQLVSLSYRLRLFKLQSEVKITKRSDRLTPRLNVF